MEIFTSFHLELMFTYGINTIREATAVYFGTTQCHSLKIDFKQAIVQMTVPRKQQCKSGRCRRLGK